MFIRDAGIDFGLPTFGVGVGDLDPPLEDAGVDRRDPFRELGVSDRALMGMFVFLLFLLPFKHRSKKPAPLDTFQAAMKQWTSSKKIQNLIQKPTLHKPPPNWKEGDIYDYGVERIFIVDTNQSLNYEHNASTS